MRNISGTYSTDNLLYKGVHRFTKSLKENVIARLEFELDYNDIVVQCFPQIIYI